MHPGRRLKPREAIHVAQLSSSWHETIVTTFPGEKKNVFLGFYAVLKALEGQIYPLDSTKTHHYELRPRTAMTPQRFQELLDQVELEDAFTIA